MSEASIQAKFVMWASRQTWWRAAFHVPNGEQRDVRTGAKLKAMGVRRGVCDFFILVPSRNYHGLILEFKKTEKDKPSPDQRDFIDAMRQNGYRVEVVWSVEQAVSVVGDYLGS